MEVDATLTTAEAATRLGVHPSRIRHLIAKGRLIAQKRGRDWLIDTAAVERLSHTERRAGRPPKATIED